MKIAIKFENEKAKAWKYPCEDLKELKPSSEGFELYETDIDIEDAVYFRIKDGAIIIDEERKCLDQENFIKAKEMQLKRNRLTALSQDLVQDMAGEIVPNINERKQEFIALHNELRALEGKEPRAVMVDK